MVYPNPLGGEAWFADKIWTPNVYIENEVCQKYLVNSIKYLLVQIGSDVLSSTRESVQVSLTPQGLH